MTDKPHICCVHDVQCLTFQVIMLSFCRGGIATVYNRAKESFESKEMPDILESAVVSPVKRALPMDVHRRAHRILEKYPDVHVPVDCYVFFTTLPDSK